MGRRAYKRRRLKATVSDCEDRIAFWESLLISPPRRRLDTIRAKLEVARDALTESKSALDAFEKEDAGAAR